MAVYNNVGAFIPRYYSLSMLHCKHSVLYRKQIIVGSNILAKQCIRCGLEFNRKPSQEKSGKFCGYECYHKSLIGVRVGVFWETATEEQKLSRIKFYFDKNVIKKDGCWGWKGSLARKYGFISINSNGNCKTITSNRASWIIHNGPIPNGLLVLHKCDTPSCTNPDHLFLGTTKDNAIDRSIKGRNANQFGENNGSAKLTREKVIQIKALLKASICYDYICDIYGISKTTISNIKSGKTWSNV